MSASATFDVPSTGTAEVYTGSTLPTTGLLDVAWADVTDDFAVISSRLTELSCLEPGWLDGEGQRISAGALQAARNVLARMLQLGARRPRVYPTPAGGIQAEWTTATSAVSLEFEAGALPLASSVDSVSGAARELESADPLALAHFVQQAT
jgi:hypothetical protein